MIFNIAVIGAKGRMGSAICDWLNQHNITEITEKDSIHELKNIDIAIEITNSHHVLKNTQSLLNLKIPTIVGASGIEKSSYKALSTLAESQNIPLWIIPNFSISAVLMMMCAQKIAHHYSHCHIIEMHHTQKLDAPSGTALHSANMIEAANGPKTQISSIRSPGIIADQQILFATTGETLSIQHHTENRDCFKQGIEMAINHITQLEPGLHIGLEFLLSL
jgi:4-hydroxy-tetrahydrodipicolinate reductase